MAVSVLATFDIRPKKGAELPHDLEYTDGMIRFVYRFYLSPSRALKSYFDDPVTRCLLIAMWHLEMKQLQSWYRIIN